MKNIKYVVWAAIVVWIFGSMFFADQISNWNINRRNKKIAEDGLQRLVDEYGLKIQNPIEDFGQCGYQYELKKIAIEMNQKDKDTFPEMANKELIDKDIFMVNCIPIIQEVLDKCDCKRNDNECKFVRFDERKRAERDCYEESGLLIFK